jgi:hypothetical protein
MSKRITASGDLTIGLDLGDRYSEACVVDGGDEMQETFRVRMTQAALDRALSRFASARTNSPWVRHLAARHGHEVIVANPRRVRLIAENDSKSDRFDCERLAHLGRLDPSSLSPIVHRGEEAQRDLVLIRSRDGLVRARSQLINQVRGCASRWGRGCPEAPRMRFREGFAGSSRTSSSLASGRCSR